ncbi:MAG: Glucosylceramidase [Bacteroidota bacterium]|jgi:glucosylceramidase
MKILRKLFIFIFILLSNCIIAQQYFQSWISSPEKQKMLYRIEDQLLQNRPLSESIIELFPTKTYQTIDGFGFTLTGSSAQMISQLSNDEQSKLLNELFRLEDDGCGISVIRLSIGASDMDEIIFSYSDEKDIQLKKFSFQQDITYLIPILKKIKIIQPGIKLIAAPWSPPKWMKTNNESKGGELLPAFYESYANYFIKYVKEMAKNGLEIYAISPQNEPLHPGNNPSLFMPAKTQAEFIKNHLGPAFEKNNINTKILIYDHNCDKPEYPIEILNDPKAKKYIFGSAFHLYNGDISAMSLVKKAHPEKELFFTEQWTGVKGDFAGDFNWHIKNVIIGALNNHARTVLEWNISNDPELKMHSPGGCSECLGALTIGKTVQKRNQAYYIIAQASKFIVPNSVRIGSSTLKGINQVAFKRPDGSFAILLQNESNQDQTITIKISNRFATIYLPKGAVSSHIIL